MRWTLLVCASALALGCGDDEDGPAGEGAGGVPTTNVEDSTFADAQEYVDAHNAVRHEVTEPDGYQGTWEPLPPVSWSDEVAESAQEWAEHLRDANECGLEHASGTGYGENLAWGTSIGPTAAVEMWAGEGSNYSYEPEYSFSSDTGHYTQIVWRDSTVIGCGSASCGGSTVVVCRYSPPGNYIGSSIY